MKFIDVKPAPGRVAFSAPQGGYQFPAGSFTRLPETPWLRNLIDKHGDLIERVVAEAPKAEPVTKTAQSKKGS